MPANIEVFANRQAGFFSAREVAWHKLGTVTDDAQTAEEAGKIAHLNDWDVRLRPLFTEAGTFLPVPGRKATVRTNPMDAGIIDVLGVVGDRYQPVQNEEAFSLLDAIVDEGGAHFETAGSLDNGRKVFMSMKLPKNIQIGGEDLHEFYLLGYNSHDGSAAFTVAVTPVRPVCQNTVTMGLRAARQTWTMRHTASVQGKIQQAREGLQLTYKYIDEFSKELTAMLDQEFTDSQFRMMTQTLLPVNKEAGEGWQQRTLDQRNVLGDLFHRAETNEFGRGTKYAAYNAVTEFADWYMPVKGADPDGTKRATRAMLAPNVQAFKNRGLALLRA